MVRPFCGFTMIDCYQDHGILSSTHVLIIVSHPCIQDFVRLLYRDLNSPFRGSIVNNAVAGCCRCSFVY